VHFAAVSPLLDGYPHISVLRLVQRKWGITSLAARGCALSPQASYDEAGKACMMTCTGRDLSPPRSGGPAISLSPKISPEVGDHATRSGKRMGAGIRSTRAALLQIVPATVRTQGNSSCLAWATLMLKDRYTHEIFSAALRFTRRSPVPKDRVEIFPWREHGERGASSQIARPHCPKSGDNDRAVLTKPG
jgi:hypothetical protein